MKGLVLIIISCALLIEPVSGQPLPASMTPGQWQQAEASARSGRHREALDRFKQMLADCGDENMIRSAGQVLKHAGAAAEPEALFLWARKKMKKPAAFAPDLAGLYQEQMRYPEAVREWSLLLQAGSGQGAAGIEAVAVQAGYGQTALWMEREGHTGGFFLTARGGMWIKAGDPEKAWASFRQIDDAQHLSVLLNDLLSRPGIASRQAVRFIGEYLERKPQDRAAWELRLAEALSDDGKPDQAVRLLENAALRSGPESGLMRARILLRGLHRPDQSREALAGMKGQWPEPFRSEGRFLLAEALMAQAQWDSARQMLNGLADASGDNALRQRALFLLGEVSFLLQDFEQAAEQYGRVAALGPAGDAVNDALSRLLLISGNKTDKIKFLKELAGARMLQAQFNFGEADKSYRALSDQAAGTAIADEARISRAEIAEHLRDYRRAVALYGEAEQHTADTTLAAESLYRAGKLIRERLGDNASARRTWEQGIVKYPDTSWADLMRSGLEKLNPAREE